MIPKSISTEADVRESLASDASGLHLAPDAVARPQSMEELQEVLGWALAQRMPITAAGGQTSTTAASITDRGLLLSLSRLDRILDVDARQGVARVQPGVLVADLARACAEQGLLFAPDPTSEQTCTVGGAVACNASGARTLMYGPTRAHVRSLRVALGTGEIVSFSRSRLEKNTVGYAMAHDPIDWFVGSEGTLGIVLEIEVALIPLPERVIGLALPFATEEDALAFVLAARRSTGVRPRCLEFFDARAAALFEGEPFGATRSPLVYVEEALDGDILPDFDGWLALAEPCGVLDGDIRVHDTETALREARRRRHAVPAATGELGARYRAAGGRRVSTDWAVPYPLLAEAVRRARAIADAHRVEAAIVYGHAGNGHPHQNYVAADASELARVEAVVEETLRWVVSVGGTLAAEHGIGKLKRRWLPLQLSPVQIAGMKALKRELDPQDLLAPGNVF